MTWDELAMNNNPLAVMEDRPRPYIMAHRGNSELCPENTMAAFQMALDDGADVIETDLHLTADGVVVCIHDESVDRTTTGRGLVRNMSFDELRTLQASYGRPEFATERIPALIELLEILPSQVGVALELKCDDFLESQVCKQLLETLKKSGAINRVVALSFSRARLNAIEKFTPEIPTGLITMFKPVPEPHWRMTGPYWPVMFLNPFYVLIGQRRGQFICPLDPTPEPRLWYYKLLGCDAVLTNNPAKTRRALGRM
jgi:glycerophosphoryl diester phosphodiesterase